MFSMVLQVAPKWEEISKEKATIRKATVSRVEDFTFPHVSPVMILVLSLLDICNIAITVGL